MIEGRNSHTLGKTQGAFTLYSETGNGALYPALGALGTCKLEEASGHRRWMKGDMDPSSLHKFAVMEIFSRRRQSEVLDRCDLS